MKSDRLLSINKQANRAQGILRALKEQLREWNSSGEEVTTSKKSRPLQLALSEIESICYSLDNELTLRLKPKKRRRCKISA